MPATAASAFPRALTSAQLWLAPECQEKNARGLTLIAPRPRLPAVRQHAKRPAARGASHGRSWRSCITSNGFDLMRQDLGLSSYTVTQVILASRNQGKP